MTPCHAAPSICGRTCLNGWDVHGCIHQRALGRATQARPSPSIGGSRKSSKIIVNFIREHGKPIVSGSSYLEKPANGYAVCLKLKVCIPKWQPYCTQQSANWISGYSYQQKSDNPTLSINKPIFCPTISPMGCFFMDGNLLQGWWPVGGWEICRWSQRSEGNAGDACAETTCLAWFELPALLTDPQVLLFFAVALPVS